MVKIDYENGELEVILRMIDNEEVDLKDLKNYIGKDPILFDKTKILG